MKSAFRSILLLAVAAVLPICAFAAFLAVVSWQQERDAVADEALDRVRALTSLVDHELAAQLELVKLLAQLPEVEAGNLAAVDATLRRVHRGQPLWLSALVAEPDGTIVVDTQLPVPGRIVDMASLAKVVETGQPLIGNIGMGNVSLGLPIRAPVMRDGRVAYAMTIVIKPEAIAALLKESALPNDWLGGIVDRSGRLVARSRGSAELLGRPASESVLAAIQRGGEGIYQGRTLEGVPSVTAYRVSPVTGWSVHIGIPAVIYQQPVQRWMWLLAGGALGVLLLAGLLVGLLVREVRARRDEAANLERGRRMESLGRLTGGIAHDFNNLLTSVMGGVEMVRRRNASTEAAPFLDAIERAAERGAQITQDLLTFVRGGGDVPLKNVDLNERIRASLGMIRQTAGPSIMVDLDLAPSLAPVTTNPIQLDLALLNLAANARDAMAGQGVLRVATSSDERHGRTEAVLAVSDSGQGIAEDHLPYVFEPFFTTKDAARGAGLGLAQVYGFAKQSGGSAEIASKAGQGTTVTIRLPTVAARAAVEAPRTAQEEVLQYRAAQRGRLLLVDDNADVRAAIAGYLRDVGFDVEEAVDAIDALDRVHDRSFDIVVSDIVMPGRINGIGLAQELRMRRPEIPVLLVSGYSDSASDAIAEGWTVISKPHSFDRLEAAIAGALDASARDMRRASA